MPMGMHPPEILFLDALSPAQLASVNVTMLVLLLDLPHVCANLGLPFQYPPNLLMSSQSMSLGFAIAMPNVPQANLISDRPAAR